MNLTPHVHCHIFPRYETAREFAGQIFTDTHFGDHYDPDETRTIDEATCRELIFALRHALTPPQGAIP